MLNTSEEWYKQCIPWVEICDPDAWNRNDFENSWREKITKEEFVRRIFASTCKWIDYKSFDRWSDDQGIVFTVNTDFQLLISTTTSQRITSLDRALAQVVRNVPLCSGTYKIVIAKME